MSRIGNKEIVITSGVSVAIEDHLVSVKGPKGELSCEVSPNIQVLVEDSKIRLVRDSDVKEVKAKHGLFRALIANMVTGVSTGYERVLELKGIGYRVQAKGKDLEFALGYSHPVPFKAPQGITFVVENQVTLKVLGIDKQVVGEVCAQIQKLRKRDAYKGKGIHFAGARIVKKSGKSVKK